MSAENPLKQLLMGNLEILKEDDPTLIDELIAQFQGVKIQENTAMTMIFIRACHSNSVNIVNAMLENGLVKDPDCYEQIALKAAIKTDSGPLLKTLAKHGCAISSEGEPWLKEACIKGALNCLPHLIEIIAEKGGDISTLKAILDTCTVSVVKNESKKDPSRVIEALERLIAAGASGTGTRENLLSAAVLAHRYSDMSTVIQALLDKGVSETAIKVSKSALATLISDIRSSNFDRPGLNKFDPIAHFRAVKDKIEGYQSSKSPTEQLSA